MDYSDPTRSVLDERYESALLALRKEIEELANNMRSSSLTEPQIHQSQMPASTRSADPSQEEILINSDSLNPTSTSRDDSDFGLSEDITRMNDIPPPATPTIAAPSEHHFTRWEEVITAQSKEEQQDPATLDPRDFKDRITEEELALIAQRDTAKREIASGDAPHLATIGKEPWIGCGWFSYCYPGPGTYTFAEDPEVLALVICCRAPGKGFGFGDMITPSGTGRHLMEMMGDLTEKLNSWSNEGASNEHIYPLVSNEDIDWETYGEFPSTNMTREEERERMVWFWRGFELVREIYKRFRHSDVDWEAVGIKRIRVGWNTPAFGWPDYSGHGEELWFPACGPHLGATELVESDRIPIRETSIYKFIATHHPGYLFLEDERIREILGMEPE